MAVPDLPLWAWNLIIAMQRHEEAHGDSDRCLTGVLNAVPADVRAQAEAISSYVSKASSSDLGKRIENNFADLVSSLMDGQPAQKPDAADDAEKTAP